MLNEADVKVLGEEKSCLEADKQRYENDKKSLLNQNKDKIEERNALRGKESKSKILIFVGIIIVAAGVLVLDAIIGKIALAIVGIIVAVVGFVKKSGNSKQISSLSSELSSCDKKEKEYNDEIAKINNRINEINKSINEYEQDLKRAEAYKKLEEEYKEYTEGHICIGCGESSSFGDGFSEASKFYSAVDEVIIYIDGVESGYVKHPFEAIAVTPGTHVVKIEAYHRIGGKNGMDFEITSKAKQVKVTENSSVYLFYNWNFNVKLQNTIFLRTFDNLFDYLKHIHEI